MLPRMSFLDRLRDMFKPPAHVHGSDGDADTGAALTEEFGPSERKDLDEARIDAGGGGAFGPPESPGSPADDVAGAEVESESE